MALGKLLTTTLTLAAFGLVSLAGAPAAAQSRADVVGTEGELYVLREGTYGELFPYDGMGYADNTALALDIIRTDQHRERILVPGTETEETEESPSALFEDDSGTLFVLWQTNRHYAHSWLNLIGYRDGDWTEPIEITGSPFGWKSSPQLAVTRDTFTTEEADGTSRTRKRTVAHLIWWEPGANGPRVFYTPVVLIDGIYTGWNPVYALDDLAPAAGASLGEPNHALAESPRLESGSNGQSVAVAFVPSGGSELVTVTLELLPGELGALADDIRAQIIDVGRTGDAGENPSSLAGKVRAQIIDVGARLRIHPGVLSYVAAQVHDRILAADPELPIGTIADDVRAQIIDVGAHVTDRGFNRLSAASVFQVVEVPGRGDARDGSAAVPPDLIRVVRASSRTLPSTGDQPLRIYLSKDGQGVVVSWRDGNSILYRESRGSGWSDVHRLQLNAELDEEHVHSLLERRADERVTPSPR